jgi:hypothetical protein
MPTKKETLSKAPGIALTGVARNTMAIVVTALILIATIFVAVYAIICEKRSGLEFVAQTLLPLWGTWVGTIMAFYFSRENFEAASKSYQSMIEQQMGTEEKMAKVPVQEVMLSIKKLTVLRYEALPERTIKDILADETFRDYGRYAVLLANDTLKYMIHRSVFYRFLAEVAMGETEIEKATDDLLFKDMEEQASYAVRNLMFKNFTFVSLQATLLDAKNAMEAVPDCKDIFVTQNGRQTEPILGLLTNNKLLEYARI